MENQNVLSLDLKIVRVGACLLSSGSLFQIKGCIIIEKALPCFVVVLQTVNTAILEHLKVFEGSFGVSVSKIYFGSRPMRAL